MRDRRREGGPRPGRPPERRRPAREETPSEGRLVYGVQPVREAVRVHGERLLELLVEADAGPKAAAVARFAEARGVRVRRASRAELDRIAGGGRHQGLAARAPELVLFPLEDLSVGEASTLVALDGVMDPQNFGAVIRSAVALGASGILWPEHSSAPLTPATFRASAGAIEHARLCRVASLPGALEDLEARGAPALLLEARAERLISEVDLRGPVVIVVGAEDRGARPAVRRACRFSARLPMRGSLDSLNASVAASLALYEVLRQRGPRAQATRGPGEGRDEDGGNGGNDEDEDGGEGHEALAEPEPDSPEAP